MNLSKNPVLQEILDRVAAAVGVRTDADVASALGVKPQALANWKKRGTVPFEALCAFAAERGLTLDYLLFGIEPKFRRRTEIDASLLAKVGHNLERLLPPELGLDMLFYDKYWYIGLIYNRLLRLPEAARAEAATDEVAFMVSILRADAQRRADEQPEVDIERLMEATKVKRPAKKRATR